MYACISPGDSTLHCALVGCCMLAIWSTTMLCMLHCTGTQKSVNEVAQAHEDTDCVFTARDIPKLHKPNFWWYVQCCHTKSAASHFIANLHMYLLMTSSDTMHWGKAGHSFSIIVQGQIQSQTAAASGTLAVRLLGSQGA